MTTKVVFENDLKRMYVKTVEIYIANKKQPLRVTGAEAQKLYELKSLNELIEINLDGIIFTIPRQNILYFATVPNDEANELAHTISEIAREVAEDVLKELPVPHCSCDECECADVVESPTEWTIEEGKLNIGYHTTREDRKLETKNPELIKRAEEIFKKIEKLENILGGGL